MEKVKGPQQKNRKTGRLEAETVPRTHSLYWRRSWPSLL